MMVPMVPDLPAAGIADLAARFCMKTIFFSEEARQASEEIARHDASVAYVPIAGFLDRIRATSPDVKLFAGVTLDDPGSLYFSSGTTGVPKGIPHTPRNLIAAAQSLADTYGFGPDDTQMGVLPCYHTALAMYGFWPSVCVGSNFVLFERFYRSRFWSDLARTRAVFVEVVPTILTILLNDPEGAKEADLSAVRFIGCGSAPLAVTLHHAFEEEFGVPVASQYGLSEAAPTHFNPPERAARREGSIGRAISVCEAKVVDPEGLEMPTGEIGEIVMRGENVISGYLNLPQETAQSFRAGWFWTGDLAYRDADGFYFLTGRRKEMISRGGQKIYPNEVDNILLSAPGVREAAAIGITDALYGEEVAAYAVVKEGYAPDEQAILAHCRRFLPPYKCPKKILFTDETPKTVSGKIMRRALVEKYNREHMA